MQDSNLINLWKVELQSISDFLEHHYNDNILDSESEFDLEKKLVLGCLASRRLIQQGCLSSDVSNMKISVTKYPRTNHRNNLAINQSIGNEYDLFSGDEVKMTINKICGYILHSKILSVFVNEDHCFGFFFNSDKTYQKWLFYISLINLISLFSSAAFDKPMRHETEVTNEGVIHKKTNSPI